MSKELSEVRIDKWLWAARFFKTRSLASTACNAGHVKVAGASVKPSKSIRPGVRIEVVTPAGPKVLEVVDLSDKRGPAPVAQKLYLDHTPAPDPKAGGPSVTRDRGQGRPSKRDLRDLRKLRGY